MFNRNRPSPEPLNLPPGFEERLVAEMTELSRSQPDLYRRLKVALGKAVAERRPLPDDIREEVWEALVNIRRVLPVFPAESN
jgi:hypothetical protein